MEVRRVIWRPSRDHLGGSSGGSFWVDSGSILRLFWTLSRTLSQEPHNILKIAFIWPWVGPKAGYILNMGPGRVPEGTRVVHPPGPPTSHHPGYTSPYPLVPRAHACCHRGYVRRSKYGRGAQIRRLTLFKCPFLRVLRYDRGV